MMAAVAEESQNQAELTAIREATPDAREQGVGPVKKTGLPIRVPLWLRLVLSLLVLGYLLWRTDLNQLRVAFSEVRPLGLAAAVGVQLFGKLVWSLRWSAMLRAFNIHVPVWRLVKAILIGQFFNNFLPTSVGGDLYRGYWILEGSKDYQRSMFIIFLERFIGLVTMGYIALPALLLVIVRSGSSLQGELLGTALVLVLLCAGIVALHPVSYQAGNRLLDLLRVRWFAELRAKIPQALDEIHSSGRLRWWIVATSIGVQFVGIGFYYTLGNAIGLELDAWHYLIIVPLVSVATMLPISINGLGVREGSLILITQALGVNVSVDQALALGLLASVMIPAVSLLGGWFHIRGREVDAERVRFPAAR